MSATPDAPWSWYDRWNAGRVEPSPPGAGRSRSNVSKAKKREVFERDGWRCVVPHCTSKRLTVDHVWPVVRGGPDRLDNLQTLCVYHNRLKGNRPMREFQARLGIAW